MLDCFACSCLDGLPSSTLRDAASAASLLQQNRIADQEARVNAWRERQRISVYEETTREEAVAAGSNASVIAAGSGDAESGAARAAGSDPLLASQGGSAAHTGASRRH